MGSNKGPRAWLGCSRHSCMQEKELHQNLFSPPSQSATQLAVTLTLNQISRLITEEMKTCQHRGGFQMGAERREEICSTRFPADAWQQGNVCLCQPLQVEWQLKLPQRGSTPGHHRARQATQLSPKMGWFVPGELGSTPSEAPQAVAVAVAVTRGCRHHFCSVSKTAALSCHQVLKEEECKTRWVLSSHTDHAHRAADEARLAQQPL